MNAKGSTGGEETGLTRRQLLGGASAAVGAALAGCASDEYYPEDRPGQPDLRLENCGDRTRTVAVTVTYLASGETVHDHAHEVSDGFCSDAGPSYYVEEVWTDPGDYRIAASAEGLPDAEATVSLSETEVGEDTGTRTIRVDDGTIEIPAGN